MVLNEPVTNFVKYLLYRVKWGANIKYIPPLNGVYIGYTVSASDEKMPRFRDYTVGYSPQTHRISITYIYSLISCYSFKLTYYLPISSYCAKYTSFSAAFGYASKLLVIYQ